MAFTLIRALIRFLLSTFYRRIEVVGAERLPAAGPLIVAANHHNSIVDAMLLMAVAPRRLRTLAKAQLFSHPLIGPFLRLAGALPVNRRQEAGDDPHKNDALFDATTATLRDGGAILIFPEGRTQPEPVLLDLRTGAARMLLAAQDASAMPITLLPVGLVFENPGIFREGRAIVLIGEPVPTEALSPSDPARDLTDRLAASLRALIVEAPDREILRLVGLVESLVAGAAGPAERIHWLKRALAGYRWLGTHEPEALAAFGTRLMAFARAMDQAGLPFGELPRTYTPASVLRFTLREVLLLLLGAPLALCGILLHGLPYLATGRVVALIPHTDEEDATDKISAGLVFYPLAWALEAWLLHRLGGNAALLAMLALLIPSGFFALSWQERVQRLGREAGAFLRILRNPALPAQWMALRAGLTADLEALAGLVPPELRT